jgi:hypothetical protein
MSKKDCYFDFFVLEDFSSMKDFGSGTKESVMSKKKVLIHGTSSFGPSLPPKSRKTNNKIKFFCSDNFVCVPKGKEFRHERTSSKIRRS